MNTESVEQVGSASVGPVCEGSLVRWPMAPGCPTGVVRSYGGGLVSVLFDGEDEPKLFSASASVLERVLLTGMVKRISTEDVGVIQGMTTAAPPRWHVFIESRVITIAEVDLRPHVLDDPRSRTEEGRFDSARQFALAVTARRYEIEQLTNDLVSLGESRVDLKPHQVSVVHRVVSDYPHRFLLCDEVGLGKTIEAGLVLKELRARGGAARCIAIVPPNLVRQWQFELKSKFNETFSILNSDTVRYLKSSQGYDGNPFEKFDSVIVSSRWISGAPWSKLMAEVPWDMVVVDEAHHARVRIAGKKREETRLYRAVRAVVSPEAFSKRAALFLTATPMQLDSEELYSLVEMLDPALFPTAQHFERHRTDVPGLSRLVHELTLHGFPPPGEDAEEIIDRVAGWLDRDAGEIAAELSAGEESIARVCEKLASHHLLSEVLIRNRKKIIGGFMPRHAHRWEVNPTPEELAALNAVEDDDRADLQLAEWFSGGETGPGADEVWDRLRRGEDLGTVALRKWDTVEELTGLLRAVLSAGLGAMSGPDDANGFQASYGGSQVGDHVYFNLGAADMAEHGQVLSPVRASGGGVNELNRMLQRTYRSSVLELARLKGWQQKIPKAAGTQEVVYGDKVINIKNRTRKFYYPNPGGVLEYVANGEIGVITGPFRPKSAKVPLDRLEVEFSTQRGTAYKFWLREMGGDEGTPPLELAYAITIHKSQGSEFGRTFVVVPSPCRLLSRELLYTALTRQREHVTVLHQGDISDLQQYSKASYSEAAQRVTNLFRDPDPVELDGKYLEAGLIHKTRKGIAVRSKSEVIIADLLFSKGIDFDYERSLEIAGERKLPDFTIEDSESGVTYYWEHLGMLQRPSYRKKWEAKKVWYTTHGILDEAAGGGENGVLITTSDGDDGSISSAAIESLIDRLLA